MDLDKLQLLNAEMNFLNFLNRQPDLFHERSADISDELLWKMEHTYKFIEQEYGADGPNRIPLDRYKIRNQGLRYLEFVSARGEEKRSDRRHNWAVTIVGALIGALASRPVWWAIDSAISLLKRLL